MRTGDRIAARRRELGLSQTRLAKAAGLSQSTIGKLEAGISFGSSQIHRIARELQTTPAYLMGDTNDPAEDAPPPPPPPTIQFISLPVAFPAQSVLEEIFEGLLRSMPDVGRDELPRELAMLLPSALARIQGPLRFAESDEADDVDAPPEAPHVARPARRRATHR